MLTLIFLSPLLLVALGVWVTRYCIRKRPYTWSGWSLCVALLVAAILLPLTQGVWILDFTGRTRTLGDERSADGQRFEVIQYWNYVDFYTTEFVVTRPDGSSVKTEIDGDANRNRSAEIILDEPGRTASVLVDGMGYPDVTW